jgi:hypothetical protein
MEPVVIFQAAMRHLDLRFHALALLKESVLDVER